MELNALGFIVAVIAAVMLIGIAEGMAGSKTRTWTEGPVPPRSRGRRSSAPRTGPAG
jgi:hypothetical protein